MTVLEALQAKVPYPLKAAFFETILIERSLTGTDQYTATIATSKKFRLATADCYKAVATGVNVTEGSLSISIPERDKLLALANSIYRQYDEQPVGATVQPGIKFLKDW